MVNEQDKARKKKAGSFFPSWGFILTITIPFVLMFMICTPAIMGGKRTAWESRAKSTLRSYGEAQLSYQKTNLDTYYGSWDALQKTGYITEGFTEGNIMDNYFLYTGVNNLVKPFVNIDVTGPNINTFTAVAFPRTTNPPGYLSTFAIHEDQILRVFYRTHTPEVIAWGEDGDFGARTWTPIR